MKLDRLKRGEAIAVVSAVALFVFMFLDWYGYEQGGNLLSSINLFVDSGNAWQTLDVIPFILGLTVAVTIGAGLLALFDSEWKPAIPPSAAVAVLGALSFGLILFRILNPPSLGEIVAEFPFYAEPQFGIYLGLAAAAGIACGGYLAMGRRGTSFAKIAHELAVKPARPSAAKPGKHSEKRPEPRS